MRSLTIGGEERIRDVVKGSLEINAALTYEIDTCSFIVSGEKPMEGEEVIVEDMGIRLFAGIITMVELPRSYRQSNNRYCEWQVDCDDYTEEIDRDIVVEQYFNMSASDIFLDIAAKYCPGFTTNGVQAGAPVVEGTTADLAYKHPSEWFKWLCDYVGWHWQVDYYRDLKFFSPDRLTSPAPMELVPGGPFEFGKYTINRQGLANQVLVLGGKMLSDYNTVEWVADGVARIWTLPFKPFDIKYNDVLGQIGVGGIAYTVGFEGVEGDELKDFLVNTEEKYIKANVVTTPANGATISFEAKQEIKVVTLYNDYASQKKVGIYKHVIEDDSLVTIAAAEAAAMAYLREHANPIVSGTFDTAYVVPPIPTGEDLIESREGLGAWNLRGVEIVDGSVQLKKGDTGLGWNMGSAPYTPTAGYEWGWGFTVGDNDLPVSKLRAMFNQAGSITVSLWKDIDQSIVASAVITGTGLGWFEQAIEPVTLVAGQSYRITAAIPANTEGRSSSSGPTDYSSYIKDVSFFRSSAIASYPSTIVTNLVGIPDLVFDVYPAEGSCNLPYVDLSAVGIVKDSVISWHDSITEADNYERSWVSDPPDGTAVKLQISLFDGKEYGDYKDCVNGQPIPGITEGMDLSRAEMYIMVILSTTDPEASPSFESAAIEVYSRPIPTYTWEPGQVVSVSLPDRNIDSEYLIQKVTRAPVGSIWMHQVQFGGRLKGIADFLKALVSAQQTKETIESAVEINKFIVGEESLALNDELILTERTLPYICDDADAICDLVVVA